MGSSSVPSATSQSVQQATGIWGSPQAEALATPLLEPALGNLKNQENMLIGVQQNDPTQMAAFLGLPSGASTGDIAASLQRHMQGPTSFGANPVSTVREDYQQYLGRAPDATGSTYWQNALTSGATPAAVASAIQSSPEGQAYAAKQSPTKTAAHGGIMGLSAPSKKDPRRKFASGSSTTTDQNTDQTAEQDALQSAATAAGLDPASAYLGTAGYFGTAYDPTTGQFSVTNPYYNQATDVLSQMNTQPAQFAQATTDYNQAISGLQGAANYTPQQIAAQQAASQGYSASSMGAPSDISAQSYNAASMQGGPNVLGATIAGPQDWTSAGTSQQYMNPYIQNVLNNQLQIQNQQNAIANNALKGQAAQAKAYGGAREQLALGQQQFNQNLTNQNIVENALANAYTSGLGQFNTAQQQQLTAQQANQSSLNQANLANQLYGAGGYNTQAANMAAQNQAMQNFVNNQLAAATTSYGGQLTAAQQNQVAQNAAAQFQAQAANAASLQNAQLGTQAAQANQQAGLTANAQNLSAYNNMLSGAQGLGSLGTAVGNYGQNLANAWGTAGNTLQTLGQGAMNQTQQNAANIWGGPTTLANQGVASISGLGGGTTGLNTTTQKVG